MKLTKVNILILSSLILVSFLFSGCSPTAQNQTLGTRAETQTVKAVTPQEAYELIHKNQDLTIVDVRSSQEYDSGHIDNAINLDYSSPTFKSQLEKLDKNQTYLVYCKSGNRSTKTAQIMQELGFSQIYNLFSGI
ncbi:hypothetical protein A2165_03825, partial [Candidatus Curtissbacteria bacterium RBG_13_40_7]